MVQDNDGYRVYLFITVSAKKTDSFVKNLGGKIQIIRDWKLTGFENLYKNTYLTLVTGLLQAIRLSSTFLDHTKIDICTPDLIRVLMIPSVLLKNLNSLFSGWMS